MNSSGENNSPRWNTAVKLVVALSIAAIIFALVLRFRNLIGPLMLTFVLSYLLAPVAVWLNRKARIPWPLAVTLLFLLIIAALAGLATWGGLALSGQISGFVIFIQNTVETLPATIAQLSAQKFSIGNFTLDMKLFDLSQALNSLLGSIEPILSNVGTIVTKIAGGAAEVIGWLAFILLISYFILLETKGIEGQMFKMEIPGYTEDFHRMGKELGKIWKTYLRGQMLIILITIAVYFVILSVLGVKFALGLAVLAGMARFVPYAGPAVAWTTLGLTCFFQAGNYFQLPPLIYAIMTVGIAWLTDIILDNFVATRMLAKTLRIHPAAVMVMALIGANLIGVIGMILASPVMASIKLFWHYIIRKMFDMDPWAGFDTEEAPPPPPAWLAKVRDFLTGKLQKIARKPSA
jgi:predicted PurR-regulated permease PerM